MANITDDRKRLISLFVKNSVYEPMNTRSPRQELDTAQARLDILQANLNNTRKIKSANK